LSRRSNSRAATAKQLAYGRDLYARLGYPSTRRVPETRQGAYMAIQEALLKLEARDRLRPVALQRPTDEQLHDLQVLARRAREPAPIPRTRGDAARELARLRSASP
jgi:hypothetical protein